MSPTTDTFAYDVTSDGSTVVGSPGFIWRLGSGTTIVSVPGVIGGGFQAITPDGSAAAFETYVGSTVAYRWTETGGFTPLPTPPGHANTEVGDISADGSVVVGTAKGGVNPDTAFRWFRTDPQTGQGIMTTLGVLPGHVFSRATAVSADGRIVVGVCDSGNPDIAVPFRWMLTNPTNGAGVMSAIPTGALPAVIPVAVSEDASVIVASVRSAAGWAGALVWTAQDQWRSLNTALRHQYGLIQPSWNLMACIDVSSDGRAILGYGAGSYPASSNWVARLPSAPCYADCNADGVLTVADFGCFQTRYVASSPYADCDADGASTINDFACFQAKFPLGCP